MNQNTDIIQSPKRNKSTIIKKKIKQIFDIHNIIIWIIMAVLLDIVLLSFYPGIMTIDGKNQWKQVTSRKNYY